MWRGLTAQAVPSVVAAVTAYGTAVLSRVEEASADASIRPGGRLLRRILGSAGFRFGGP